VRRIAFAVLALLSCAVAAYAIVAYGFGAMGEGLHPEMRASFEQRPAGLMIHVFASALALALGPFQFSVGLRARRPALHRWLGRLYLGVGVLAGGLAGLYLSTYAYGGAVARAGFATLAMAWLATGVLAYAAVRGRDYAAHRRWMLRNYALTFAAVTLRLYLPAGIALRIPFELAYAAIAWACWVPNLLVAEWLARARPAGR